MEDDDVTNDNDQTMPPPKNGLLPYLTVDGAVRAAEFYKRAFGAEQAFMVPPDEKGRTMHVHLYINGSSLMLSDAYPEHGHPLVKPQSFSLQLVVDDIDSWWDRAVAAGAEVVMPVELMFWGDRYGQLRDPFGIIWAMNAPAKGN
jgi:PhnB protein